METSSYIHNVQYNKAANNNIKSKHVSYKNAAIEAAWMNFNAL